MKSLLLIAISIALPLIGNTQTLIMNEVSQGVTGNMEYIEFVVIDTTVTYDCSTGLPPAIDVRGWIIDDNSGYHGASGVAPGCIRFSFDPLWSNLPLGTIIVVYNDAQPEVSLPADDLSMADGNCLIVAPISDVNLFESNATTPGAVACSYPAVGWTAGGNWSNILLANTGDCARIVDLAGCEQFSVCWGTANLNTQIYFGGNAGNTVFYFDGVDPDVQGNWLSGCTDDEVILDANTCGSNEQTPGLSNTAPNAAYIASFNNGCTPIPALTSSVNVGSHEVCSCDGEATASGAGSIGPYTFTWTDAAYTPIGQTSATATGLCAGDYNVIVESSIGCLDTTLVTINAGSAPVIDSIVGTDPTCNGACDGSITVYVSGGTPPYNYQWYDSGLNPIGTDSPTLSGQCPGSYSVDVTDAAGAPVVFFTEDYGTGCTQNLNAHGVATANGVWTVTDVGVADVAASNYFFISSTEAGMGNGNCGDGCLADPLLTDRTLHIGNDPATPMAFAFCPSGDCGAAYDANVASSKRAESPVIDCTGELDISLTFDYIHMGEGGLDFGSVWYFDGLSWAVLQSPIPQVMCCDLFGGADGVCDGLIYGQGRWEQMTVTLPASADNNPNVQIAIQWENDGNGLGTDPSLAVDNLVMSSMPTSCVVSANATLTDPAPITVAAINDGSVCAGQAVTLTENGGDGVSWSWTSTNGTATINTPTADITTATGVANGEIFQVVVTDGNGCQDSITTTVTVNPLPNVSAVNSGPICPGETITLTENGGDAVSWLWTSTNGTATINTPTTDITTATGVADGEIFQVVVTDGIGCQDSTTTTVTFNPLPNVSAINSGPICLGQTLTLTENGGDGTSWNWTSTNGTATINTPTTDITTATGVTNGEIFQVVVTDGNGCSDSTTTTVTVNPLPNVTAINGGPYCTGDAMSLNETGGDATSWSWSSSGSAIITNTTDQAPVVTNATSGEVFTVIVTDGNNCTNTDQTTMIINNCCATLDTADYDSFEYTTAIPDLIPGATVHTTPQTLSVRTGTYSCYMNFTNGYQGVVYDRTYDVCQGMTYQFSAWFNNTWGGVPDVDLNLTVYDALGNVIYQVPSLVVGGAWTEFNTGQFVATTATIRFELINNITGGVGNNDCSMDDLLLERCAIPVNNGIASPVCSNGSAVDLYNDLPISMSNTGAWTGPSGLTGGYLGTYDPVVNTVGTYTYTVTGAGACPDSISTVDISTITAPDVFAGGLLPGCDSVALPVIAGSNLTSGELYYTGMGGSGTSYTNGDWVNSNTTLYIYDETGILPNCMDEDSIQIALTPTPTLSVIDTTTCSSNTVDITNTTYWSASAGALGYYTDNGLVNPVADPTQVGAGTYYIEAVDGTCSNYDSLVVTVTTTPTLTLQDTTGCSPFTVDLTNTLIWNTDVGAMTFYTDAGYTTPLATPATAGAGTYFVQAVNGTCTSTGTVVVSENLTPLIAGTGSDPNVCNAADGEIEVTLTSGATSSGTLDWTGTATGSNPAADITLDSPDITTLTAGNYDVTFTDVNGCISNTVQVSLSNPNAPVINTLTPLTACDSVQLPAITGTDLTVNVGYWTGMGGTGTQLATGDWISTSTTVYAYDSTDVVPTCWDEEPLQITVNTTPVLDPVADTTACGTFDLPVLISGTNLTGNEAYYNDSQVNNGTVISGTLSTTQTIYIFDDNNGCSDEISYVVTIDPLDDPSFSLTDHCEGDPNVAVVTGSQGGTFDFEVPVTDGAAIDAGTGTVTNGVGGTNYGVTYTTSGNCPATSTQIVQVFALPGAPTLSGGGIYCENSDIPALSASGSGGTFDWFDDAGLTNNIGSGTSIQPSEQVGISTYYAQETSLQGCVGPANSTTVEVEICDIVIPTAFTPNADLIHDDWEIQGLDQVYPNNIVTVFNRWGSLLFQHNSQTDGPYDSNRWDGIYNGKQLPVASYYYIIEFNNNDKESVSGTVTIVAQ